MEETLREWEFEGHPCKIGMDCGDLVAHVDGRGYVIIHDAGGYPKSVWAMDFVKEKVNHEIQKGVYGSDIMHDRPTESVKFVVEK